MITMSTHAIDLNKIALVLTKCLPIAYGAKAQLNSTANTSEQLDLHQKCCIQVIVRLLLYFAQAVNNKLLVDLVGSPKSQE
jgi:hypothetical protein